MYLSVSIAGFLHNMILKGGEKLSRRKKWEEKNIAFVKNSGNSHVFVEATALAAAIADALTAQLQAQEQIEEQDEDC